MKQFFANCIVVVIVIVACGKEKPLQAVATTLKIDLGKTTLAPSDTAFSVNVTSNANWEVLSLPGWLAVDQKTGSGNGRVTFKVNENKDDSIRIFVVTIRAKDVSRQIRIDQMPYLKLKRAIGVPGNSLNKTIDSIRLEFNQPVTMTFIRSTYNLCLSDIQYTYKDSNSTVQFSYACGGMGGEYPFTISARSQFNETLTENIKAGFYSKRINLEGFPVSDFADYKENSYWLLLKNPHALYKIDMSSFEVLQKIPFAREPRMFTISPYNNKLYLAYTLVPELHIMSKEGAIEKVIPIPTVTGRPDYYGLYPPPEIHPLHLRFTKSGIGLIALGARSTEEARLWFIDAADNHRIWYNDEPEMNFNIFGMKKIHTSYDNDKLLLAYFKYNYFSELDPATLKFRQVYGYNRNSPIGDRYFIVPSPKQDQVYFNQTDVHGILNAQSGDRIPAPSSAVSLFDFSNSNGSKVVGYTYTNGYNVSSFEVVDITGNKVPLRFDAQGLYYSLHNTLDGKYTLAVSTNGNGAVTVVQFPDQWFKFE